MSNTYSLMAGFPSDLDQAFSFASKISKSQLIPKSFQNKPEDIIIAMMWANNLKMPFLQILQGLAVINGRPILWGDTALAVVRGSGLLEDIKEEVIVDERAGLIAKCSIKRKGQASAIVRTFSLIQAKNAGLMSRDPWAKYTHRMLQMRARSYAIRDGFADVLNGIGVEDQMDVEFEVKAQPVVEQQRNFQMPKRREAPQLDARPQPTLEPVQEKEVVEVQPVASQAPVENHTSENLFGEDQIALWTEKFYAAKDKKELNSLWRASPKELRNYLTEAFKNRTQEIMEEDSLAASVADVHQVQSPMPQRASSPEPTTGAPF